MIAWCALVFGLLGMLWPWGGVRSHVLVPTITLTFVACILMAQGAYTNRFALREEELLTQVKRGWKKGAGPKMRASLAPVIAIVLTIFLALAIVKITLLWDLMEWLVLEPPSEDAPLPQEDLSLREKVTLAFPLMCLIGYTMVLIALAYSSSLMLSREYARRLNERPPQPIFLGEDLLTKVVRREAERVVCRPITPIVIGGEETPTGTEQEPRNWIWDEMERTADGGIRLKAIARAGSKTEERSIGEWTERPVYITYVIKADPWSRITKVERIKEPE